MTNDPKIRFFDDYSEGVHPEILRHITENNIGQQPGYGNDYPSVHAATLIQQRFGTDGDVHFLSGATQANLIGLSSMLQSYQGVIAPTSGHIVVHEAGSVEATGHKVITVDAGASGRLTPALVDEAMTTHEDEHTVMPKAVFLTQATELGSVYSKQELQDVAQRAKAHGLYVFVDGARLAMALASDRAQMQCEDIVAAGVDMFSVGGTKNGGMFGEALVVVNNELRPHFRYRIKQRGALMAKGRFLGLQFERFFGEDDMWMSLGHVANQSAMHLAQLIEKTGTELAAPCEANQVFAIVDNAVIERMREKYGFYTWAPATENKSVIRLVCSWATKAEDIEQFATDLAAAG